MTGTAIDPEAAVEQAKSAAGILPEAGKTEVLEHLLSGMSPEALKALSHEDVLDRMRILDEGYYPHFCFRPCLSF